MHAHGRRVELYAAVGIAVLAAANVAKEIVVPAPGVYKITIS